MHLRNGIAKINFTSKRSMAARKLKNTSLPQIDAPNIEEQPTKTMVGGVVTSTSIEVTSPIISQMSISTVSQKVAVSPSQVISIPTASELYNQFWEILGLLFSKISP